MQIAAIFVCNLLLSHSNNSQSSSSRSNNCCCCCSCFKQLQLEARQTPRKEKLCRPLQVTLETSYVGEGRGKMLHKSNQGKAGAEWRQRDFPHSGSSPINAVKFIMTFAFGMSAGCSDSEHSLWQLFIRSLALTRSPSLSLCGLGKPQLVA